MLHFSTQKIEFEILCRKLLSILECEIDFSKNHINLNKHEIRQLVHNKP